MAPTTIFSRRTVVAGAFGLISLLGPSAARADDRNEAEARFQEGIALYKEGKIDDARLKLVQAYAVLGRPNILWNLAVAEFYSSHPLDSLRHMRKYVKLPEATAHDINLAKENFIPKLEQQTGRIAVKAADGTALKVDGEDVGAAPLAEAVDVLPGKHVVIGRAPGQDATIEVEVAAGQTVPAVFAEPARKVEVAPPAETPRNMVPRNVTVIGLAAGAVVAAGVGIAFVLKASGAESDGEKIAQSFDNDRTACAGNPHPDCARLKDLYDTRNADTGVAAGFFIGAGALAVAAGLTYVLWPRDAERARAARLPVVVAPRPGGGAAMFDIVF